MGDGCNAHGGRRENKRKGKEMMMKGRGKDKEKEKGQWGGKGDIRCTRSEYKSQTT